jgi:4-amino-4-deoxy-L-arabinose transferase-like glycosyltransferase
VLTIQKKEIPLLIFILTLVCLRIVWLFIVQIDLYGDEAQYWLWSQNPALGYYSKPPVLAWIIKLTTFTCGNSEACIRLSSPILHALTSFFIFLIGEHLFDRKVGTFSAVIYLTLPSISLSSNIASTDPSLLFFWSMGLYATLKAFHNDTWKTWILSGIICGFGMLTKYNMLMFLPSVLLFLFLEKRFKHYITHTKFCYSILIAFLIWSPNLWWNITNEMSSISHVVDQLKGPRIIFFNIKGCFDFILGQFAIFGPYLLTYLIFNLSINRRLFAESRVRLLLSFSIPFLLVTIIVALLSRANINWAAPAYITLTILTAYIITGYNHIKFLYFNVFFHTFIAIAVMSYVYCMQTGIVSLTTKTDILKRFRGAKELGQQLSNICKSHPSSIIATDNRMNLALFSYYTYGNCPAIIKWNPSKMIKDHFDLTTDLNKHRDEDVILVTNYSSSDALKPFAKNVETLNNLSYTPYTGFDKKFNVYILKQFKGY